jgi:hypothetical protein
MVQLSDASGVGSCHGAQHERSHNNAAHIEQRGRLAGAIHDTVDLRLVRDVASVDRRAA